MIKRYSDTYIENVWSDQYKFDLWNDITTLYIRNQAKTEISFQALRPEVLEKKVKLKELSTKHEFVAFLAEYLEQFNKYNSKYARYAHYGLTSSDIIDTADSIRIKKSIKYVIGLIESLCVELQVLSKRTNIKAVGRTHGKHAEEINWNSRIAQTLYEIREAKLKLSFASGACFGKLNGPVGTSSHINIPAANQTLKDLNLDKAPFSTQIIPRIHNVEVFYAGALLASVYQRFATLVRLSSIDEINELQEGFKKGQTGSSAMPHKNNPILSENITGLSRIIKSYLSPAFENINLWWERDISHSSVERILFPDLFHLLSRSTMNMITLVKNINVNKEDIILNLKKSNISSHSELLKELKDSSRFEAYYKIQERTLQ